MDDDFQGGGEVCSPFPSQPSEPLDRQPPPPPRSWSYPIPPETARQLDPGLGMAVGRRTVFRASDHEDWGRVADRVSEGNLGLLRLIGREHTLAEAGALRNAIACGALLTSGRHLQHGDADQWRREETVFSNCATAATSFMEFYLLLNGSGVGRSYDDALMTVDWANAPEPVFVLAESHPDCVFGWTSALGLDPGPTPKILKFVPKKIPAGVQVFSIPDSREGWAQALEEWESAAAERRCQVLILNFSAIRPAGAPIGGMQGRPASGPISLMRAFAHAWQRVVIPAKTTGMPRWEQAMRLDHEFSTEVQVGGARRSARMSTKDWRDPGVIEFALIKAKGGLWTSNNSIMVDAEFWQEAAEVGTRAHEIFTVASESAYQTGEPGWINGDLLEDTRDRFAAIWPPILPNGTELFRPTAGRSLLAGALDAARDLRFPSITNPCGEIPLHVCGGFCVLADIAPVLACPMDLTHVIAGSVPASFAEEWDARVLDAAALAARFLVRVNLMPSIYQEEVARTNRIGIGLTGLHEWAWLRWRLGFRDLLDEDGAGQPFWAALDQLSREAKREARHYSILLRVSDPFTVTTCKPAGTTAKLMGVTEGAHLPARRGYLRWVQFKGSLVAAGADPALPASWATGSDPLLPELIATGYPWRELKTFPGMTIIGFPTRPLITRLGMDDRLVTAPEATPAEQYQWLRLLEKHWLGRHQANQISYTLKLYTDQHSLADFRAVVLANQPTIKCCSILPSRPESEMCYEYLPEEPVSDAVLDAIESRIGARQPAEDVDMETLRCASGVCPI